MPGDRRSGTGTEKTVSVPGVRSRFYPPGMQAGAPRRNAIVGLLYVLGLLVAWGIVEQLV